MKEKGWLDPWGTQHELLCNQYMADEAVMGSCTCRKLKALREQIAQEIEGRLIGLVDGGTFNEGIIVAVNIARGE